MNVKLRRTIAWWQIACGLMGLAVFVAAWLELLPNGRRWIAQVIGPANFVGGIFFFIFAVVVGRSLLRGQRWAILASIGIQLSQAVSFAFLEGPKVSIAAGPAIDLTVGSASIGFEGAFHSSFYVGKLVQGPEWSVTLNLLALLWSAALIRSLRPMATRIEDEPQPAPSASAL